MPESCEPEFRRHVAGLLFFQGVQDLGTFWDDWSAATFWYEAVPSAPLPPMPDVKVRTTDIWEDKER